MLRNGGEQEKTLSMMFQVIHKIHVKPRGLTATCILTAVDYND